MKSTPNRLRYVATGILFMSLSIIASTSQSAAAAAPPPRPLSVISLDAGASHACEIKSNGTLACWGGDTEGKATAPQGSFTRLSSGWMHNCAIQTDGTAACWGFDEFGQASPSGGTFTETAVGALHSCGVRTDGSLDCWGDNLVGQASPPPGSFTQVTAGSIHSCALREDESVACWGENLDGRADPPAGTFTQISTGNHHNCGVRSDGTVACWGNDGEGRATPPGGTFMQVSAGGRHSCGVKTDGTLACWGANDKGQASPPSGAFARVSAGGAFSCAETTEGFVQCWGDNEYGQAPMLTINPASLPDGQAGVAYSQQLAVEARDYAPPSPEFAVVAGSLPPGLTLDTHGALKGKPTTAGSYDVTVRAVDANAFAAQQAYTLVIAEGAPFVQDNASSVQYDGWRGLSQAGASGGVCRMSHVKGDTVQFTFKGTSVQVITMKGPDQGKMQVRIDGKDRGTVDLYAAVEKYKVALKFEGLADAKHKLKLEVLGTKNSKSKGTNVVLDAFLVGKKKTEETANAVRYNGWQGKKNVNANGKSLRVNGKAGARARYTFTGTSIEWITAVGPSYGMAEAWIDNAKTKSFDLYAATQKWQVARAFTGLSAAKHTLEIRVLGTKNTASKGTAVVVDAFRLTGGSATLPRASEGVEFSKPHAALLAAPRGASIYVPCGDVAALRAAIVTANDSTGADTLELAPGCTYTIADVFFHEPGTKDYLGLPYITSEITINGHGATITRTPPVAQSEEYGMVFFWGDLNSSLTLNDLTCTGAFAFRGSCLWNSGILYVNDSLLTDNDAIWSGPAIQNNGVTIVTDVTSTYNTSGYYGSGFWGGAFDNGVDTTRAVLRNMTIAHNDNGVFNEHSGQMELYNVTIANNADTGLYNAERGVVSINNSTISGNGYGIGTDSPPVTLANTILANNAWGNCWGPIDDDGNNLDSDGSCIGTGTDPKLDPNGLQDNGGPTQTIALQPDSPAIDAGKAAVCGATFINNLDQRGVFRPLNGDGVDDAICDIGAFEAPTLQTEGAGFIFAVDGDFAYDSYAWNGTASTSTLQAIANSGAAFALVLGDLSRGAATPAHTELEGCSYVKQNVGDTFPFEVLVGNHEDQSPATDPNDGNIDKFRRCLPDHLGVLPGTYALTPTSEAYGKEFYFDYNGLARFILIMPNAQLHGETITYPAGSDRYNWVRDTIAEARQAGIPWVIVGMHPNCVTSSPKDCEMGADLFNLLVGKPNGTDDAYKGVDLILQSHAHLYQRSKQLAQNDTTCNPIAVQINSTSIIEQYLPGCVVDDGADGLYTKGEGAVVVIVGTGGWSPVAFKKDDLEAPYFANSMDKSTAGTGSGFVKVNLSATTLQATFVNTTGGTWTDSFTIGTPPTTLVDMGSTWKFLDNGSDQGTAWKEGGFDDSGWAQGPAELGYGDGDEATVVSYGLDANNKYVTTYFRHTFTVSDPAQFSSLTLNLVRDDGAVVYLNGIEVMRNNMPDGTVDFTTRAKVALEDDNPVVAPYTFSQALLEENVLAVEIHQWSKPGDPVTSSDISFDLELKAQ